MRMKTTLNFPYAFVALGMIGLFGFAGMLPAAINNVTGNTSPAMFSWGPADWVTFFGSLSLCITTIALAFQRIMQTVKEIMVAVKELRSVTVNNAKALVPLMEQQKSLPGDNVPPEVEAKVRQAASMKVEA